MIDSVRQAAVRPTCGAQSATSPKAVSRAFARIAKQVRGRSLDMSLRGHANARAPSSERMRARSADHPER
ncbi:hypothetical protein [Xanthomonas axonopodis]|uniref:hypothetical protein n=1 Tax=Xanthomonas axonopodis TaxID=53413 RepID=UPI002014ED86|nr:hypothetical protein [Xanthomonas axonopodis]